MTETPGGRFSATLLVLALSACAYQEAFSLVPACWADNRRVPQIAFKPDFTRHKNAAPFKRNDQLLETLPIGVVVFPGSGISDNLADKARKLSIPLLDYRQALKA